MHLCSGYELSSLYFDLIKSLNKRNIKQIVYIPLNKSKQHDVGDKVYLKNVVFVYSKAFRDIDRIFYNRKSNILSKDIINKISLDDIELIHAHSLFSMGGVALKLKKEKKIDYIVVIRNTDVNVFFKYMVHIRRIGIQILKEAKKVVFINPLYKRYVINHYVPNELKNEIDQKSIVIPNGLNDFWIKNRTRRGRLDKKGPIKLIFVGDFTKNKNIINSIYATTSLKRAGYNIHFSIIGSYGKGEQDILKLARKNRDIVTVLSRIKNKEDLMEQYRKSDIFLMPSFHETFGLVYLEAMSQGLPIIYSEGQGVDGYFQDGEVGFAVNPKSIDDIVMKIEKIIDDYDRISENCYNSVEKFSWDEVGRMHNKIYLS